MSGRPQECVYHFVTAPKIIITLNNNQNENKNHFHSGSRSTESGVSKYSYHSCYQGNIDCACLKLSEAIHKDSESLGDRVYGNITESLLGSHWTSKKLDYWIDVKKDPEETTLTLMRNTYKYSE